MTARRASHANSWYSGNPAQLERELTSWLAAADQTSHPAKAVICPHAGYSYSGATAAYSFKQLDPNTVKTELTKAMEKTKTRCRIALLLFIIKYNFVSPGQF